uniref:Uncharacterized protein n=1 Tax=Lepeophtheirus salmonis TaxID=72036 RepID=A0A0K2VJG2_LEPSM
MFFLAGYGVFSSPFMLKINN